MPDGKRKEHYLEPLGMVELESLHAKTVEPTVEPTSSTSRSTTSCRN
jgi:hypothetical protein